jgi:hypothetical protein
VSGSVATGIRFRHADGSDYGRAPEPGAVEIQAKAFRRATWPGLSRGRGPSSAGRLLHAWRAGDEHRTGRTRCAGQTDPAVRPCLIRERPQCRSAEQALLPADPCFAADVPLQRYSEVAYSLEAIGQEHMK